MPSSWEQIPKELLVIIIDQIEEDSFSATNTRKSCLFQLMLTCKHWSSIATEAFYNEPFLLDMLIAKEFDSDETTQQLPPKNIVVTHRLANNAALVDLLSMCPDVTRLCVHRRPPNARPPSALNSFYTFLYVLSRSHHLTKLRMVESELQDAQADQLLAPHQRAMLQLKHSLTHLQIVDSTRSVRQHNYTQPPQIFVEWFDRLQDFPRLMTTVRIDVGTVTYLYELDRCIQKMGPTVTNIHICMENTRVLQPLTHINPATIARRSSTKILNLEMLSELKIAVLHHEFNETSSLNEFGSDDSLKRFFEYLTRLSKYLVTNILIHNSLLRQALVDLKKCFQIKHLTLSNVVPTCQGTVFSIKPLLSRARDGHRPQALLDLEIGTAQLLSVARLVYEVLNEDVVELQFGNGLIRRFSRFNGFRRCHVQGEAVQLGINLLPSLKILTADTPGIDSMKSIVDPKAPKLALDLLKLGKLTRLAAFLQMSQRIQHIERWIAPYLTDYKEGDMDRENYVLNMPLTTFGEINIDSVTIRRYIVKLSTSSNTTFHGVSLSRDEELPTEDDYYDRQDKESMSMLDFFKSFNNELGKVTIVCADVKRLKVGGTLINIKD